MNHHHLLPLLLLDITIMLPPPLLLLLSSKAPKPASLFAQQPSSSPHLIQEKTNRTLAYDRHLASSSLHRAPSSPKPVLEGSLVRALNCVRQKP